MSGRCGRNDHLSHWTGERVYSLTQTLPRPLQISHPSSPRIHLILRHHMTRLLQHHPDLLSNLPTGDVVGSSEVNLSGSGGSDFERGFDFQHGASLSGEENSP